MEAQVPSAKRHRSPSYPAIPLRVAIDRARAFYQHERRNAANVVVAMKHWGYAPVSGRGRMTLAALITFGLLKDSGTGDHRQVQLTDVALRILLDDRPDSAERREAIKEAALTPKIYRSLVSKWPGLEVSDANLRHYLIFDRKFNENAVADFIKDLRDTILFAKVVSAPDNGLQDEDPEGGDEGLGDVSPPPPPTGASAQPLKGVSPPAVRESRATGIAAPPMGLQALRKAPGMRQEVFSLAEGDVVVQWPEELSKDSLQDVADWLPILERKIKRSVAPGPAPALDLSDGSDADDL